MHPDLSTFSKALLTFAGAAGAFACGVPESPPTFLQTVPVPTQVKIEKIQNPVPVIHVLVALCDNVNQGIVPVPARLGNGDEPSTNLYWGAAYGVKTFFSKSPSWALVSDSVNPKPNVLERVVFKQKNGDAILVADAYQGSKMRETVDDFFSAASGAKLENLDIGGSTIQILGSANLIVFVGHDGLMDFKIDKTFAKKDDQQRQVMVLACASKSYFAQPLRRTAAEPLLWTTNLMAPEAYILFEATDGWLKKETGEQIRSRAAAVYAKYQKISRKSADGLFATGW